ncbi:hypothetical protein OQA88_5336 [Cercophora sp. LCS_1]
MAPTPLSAFVKPSKKSRAIPIVDPSSRKAQPVIVTSPTSDKASLTLSAKAKAQKEAAIAAEAVRTQIQNGLFTPAVSAPTKVAAADIEGAAKRRKSVPIRTDSEPGFDVYATPFVPEHIKIINTVPGRVIHTLPSKTIDTDAYGADALGRLLLPPPPRLNFAASRGDLLDGNSPPFNPESYGYFFRFHLNNEMGCLEKENNSYALYVHEGVVEFLSDTHAKVTLDVPGLREATPYLEEDDIVELRHLRVTPDGQLHAGAQAYGPQVYDPSITFYPAGPWTGNIYHARVTAVINATEQLVLQVLGLTLQSSEVLLGGYYPNLPLPVTHSLRFNVQFPVALPRFWPYENVLGRVQEALNKAVNVVKHHWNDNMEGHKGSFWIQSMLFPTEADGDLQANASAPTTSLFDSALNLEQQTAVENINLQNYGVLPYLISGPPGTGKTKTIIEIALQLVQNPLRAPHILICAPSEQAADTLADRLRWNLQPQALFRLNRPTRAFNEVPDSILPYCHLVNDAFALPPFADLMAYKVIVTSCRDADMLLSARMTNTDLHTVSSSLTTLIHPNLPPPQQATLHFSALLIDEAAQATEPETLIPLLVVAPPPSSPPLTFTPLLVMAGDEHQLNPRTSSPATPLRRSLFARLFARPVYANHPLARSSTVPVTPAMLPVLRPAFTNLIRNYRSHPAILAVPSALFYADTLIPCANPIATKRLVSWHGFPKNWPVLFHDNQSPDELERDGGGWYNDGEALLACTYAQSLVKWKLVKENEVCIMSPFKAQVRRIRQVIRGEGFGLWNVNVGPTEAFQGLEYGVVILCVTRSKERFVERDKELGWGIVGKGNRMNVALTRAKSGLVVIGRREVLVGDVWWREWVGFCERNGLVVGGRKSGEEKGRRTRIERELMESEGAAASAGG